VLFLVAKSNNMANKPKNMLQVRRILQLLSDGHSKREVSRQTGSSRNTIDSYETHFQQTGKDYHALTLLSDTELAELVYTKEPIKEPDPRRHYLNDHLDYYINELTRVGVTRELLWNEYRQEEPEGYGYSQFCELLSRHSQKKNPVYHNIYVPGELLEFDFAGKKMSYVDRLTGEIVECPVLVCTLPYSSFSYIEPLVSFRLEHLVPAMNRMVQYLGGVTKVVLTDNMRQVVTQTNRYEPSFTLLAEQWSVHYNTCLKAARPAKPKDKPSVEKSVHLSYQRINARMRNEIFYSLAELKQRVSDLLEEFNNRPMFKQSVSRRDKFINEEKHLLRELPVEPFMLKSSTKAKVKPNYHAILGEDWHQYSVPHQYIGHEVVIVYDELIVEIFIRNLQRIAVHKRDTRRNGYTTLAEHMPESHIKYKQQKGWTEDDFISKALLIGEQTAKAINRLLGSKAFIEQTYDGCLGVLRLADKYGNKRLESACRRANTGSRINYKIVHNILKNNLDKLPTGENELSLFIPEHENIRGAEAYN
jgi:transposase